MQYTKLVMQQFWSTHQILHITQNHEQSVYDNKYVDIPSTQLMELDLGPVPSVEWMEYPSEYAQCNGAVYAQCNGVSTRRRSP